MPFQFRKEAIEEDLNSNFPSQGQGNPPLYYSLSEVVVPTYSINNAAEGSILPSYLQNAWDFSTTNQSAVNTTNTLVNNTGFWLANVAVSLQENTSGGSSSDYAYVAITDGLNSKRIFRVPASQATTPDTNITLNKTLIVFLKSGESLTITSGYNGCTITGSVRQIAQVNGTLVNPLGFSAA